MPSLRSVSYKFFFSLELPREDKVAGPFCLESLEAILVPRPRGEKGVWQIGMILARKMCEKAMDTSVGADHDAVYHGF
jgi:hypothetical protein